MHRSLSWPQDRVALLSELPQRFVSIDTYPRAFSAAVVEDMLNDNLSCKNLLTPLLDLAQQSAFLGVARTEHSFHDFGRDCLFHAATRASHYFTFVHMHSLHCALSCPRASACAFEGSTICTVCLVSPYRLGVSFCRTLGPDCFLCFPSPTYLIPHSSPIYYS